MTKTNKRHAQSVINGHSKRKLISKAKLNGHSKSKKIVMNGSKPKKEDRYDEMKEYCKSLISQKSLQDSFYLFDLTNVVKRIEMWRRLIPRVEIYYAAKCNPDSGIIKTCHK